MSKTDGGPAFPAQPMMRLPDGAMIAVDQGGMTLRDWFAGHVDQPGRAEVTKEAGVKVRGENGVPWDDKEAPLFDEWWGSLDNASRFALYARVRFGMADAMIAERDRP